MAVVKTAPAQGVSTDQLELSRERLVSNDFKLNHFTVDLKSDLGQRLQNMMILTHANDANLILSFVDQGMVRTCAAQWLEGRANSKQISIKTTDGEPFSLELLEARTLSVSLSCFNDQSRIPFTGGRFFVDLPLDMDFRASSPYDALMGELSIGQQRFIVSRPDPDYPKVSERLPSARFVEAKHSQGEQQFVFESDAGAQFTLPESDIREISRAGKGGTLVSGAHRHQVKGEDKAIQVSDLNSDVVSQHFALYQKVELTYVIDENRASRIENFAGAYLGFHKVPKFGDGGIVIQGKFDTYLFLLGEAPHHQVFAVRDSNILGMTGILDNDLAVGGRSRTPGLGQIPAYTSGSPLYSVE